MAGLVAHETLGYTIRTSVACHWSARLRALLLRLPSPHGSGQLFKVHLSVASFCAKLDDADVFQRQSTQYPPASAPIW